jgi:hypothetical protein
VAYFSLFHVRQVAYAERSLTNDVATVLRVWKGLATKLSEARSFRNPKPWRSSRAGRTASMARFTSRVVFFILEFVALGRRIRSRGRVGKQRRFDPPLQLWEPTRPGY